MHKHRTHCPRLNNQSHLTALYCFVLPCDTCTAELLDLDPLPLSALKNPLYELLYTGRFTHFNPIQASEPMAPFVQCVQSSGAGIQMIFATCTKLCVYALQISPLIFSIEIFVDVLLALCCVCNASSPTDPSVPYIVPHR